MMIETKNKTINLVLKTRKIVDIANLLKNKNFEEAFIKSIFNIRWTGTNKNNI